MELKEGIKQINQSVTQSSASDATLEGYMLELKDANGNLVDKQPVSKIESLVYNYLTTKRQSELAKVMSVQKSLGGANDNVFIMFQRKDTSYPLMVKPDKWASYQNSGEIATGVAVVDGERTLVIAPTEASLYWSSAAVSAGGKTTRDRPTALGDFEGKANTASQITHAECSGASYAAGYCAQYSSVNGDGQGLTAGKWWLPSLGELMMIYANKDKINYALSLISGATQLAKTRYWSSTEYNEVGAWSFDISNYNPSGYTKAIDQLKVRPVSSISLNLPSFYKDYPDIASLASGIRPQTIKNGGSERIYKIGVIPQGYNPFCYNFWVAGTNAGKPVECTLIVGDEGAGKGLADNVVMYKDWGAVEIGVSNFVEIAVVARTVYLVCKADVSITFGEYAEEVTGVDLSSAYNVPFKKIPTFYKNYNSLSELKDALKAIW